MNRRGVVVLTLVALAFGWCSAVEAVPGTDLDLSVSEAPAFTVLDVAPENVTRPATPRDLAASLLNGVDRSGHLQTGVALAFAPYRYSGSARRLTLTEYRDSDFQQILFRTEASLATTKGAGDDDDSVRLSAGLRSVLWAPDEGRQDLELDTCLERNVFKAWKFLGEETWPATIQQALADLYNKGEVNGIDAIVEQKVLEDITNHTNILKSDLISKGIKKEDAEAFVASLPASFSFPKAAAEACFAAARERAWNGRAAEIGGAFSMISTDGKFGDLESNGGALWASVSYGFQDLAPKDAVATTKSLAGMLHDNLHVIGHLRYRNSAVIVEDDGTTFDQDDILVGGRVRIKPIQRFRDFALSAEVAFVHAMRDGRKDDDSLRYAATAEVKIAKDLWLQATAGTKDGDKEGDESFVVGGIKFGFDSESAFAAREAELTDTKD